MIGGAASFGPCLEIKQEFCAHVLVYEPKTFYILVQDILRKELRKENVCISKKNFLYVYIC